MSISVTHFAALAKKTRMQRPSHKASIKEHQLDAVAMDEVNKLLGNAPQEKDLLI